MWPQAMCFIQLVTTILLFSLTPAEQHDLARWALAAETTVEQRKSFSSVGGPGLIRREIFQNRSMLASNVTALEGRSMTSACSSMKLVVNSHVDYSKALNKFIDSLRTSRFDRFNDIIIVRGGAGVAHIAQDTNGITTIDWPLNNNDLTAFSALYAHRKDWRVKAAAYVLVLDTSEVGPTFPSKLADYCDVEPQEVRMAPRPNSNMPVAFGAGLVEAYGHNFDYPVPKQEGLCLEVCGVTVREVAPVERFASKITYMAKRRSLHKLVDVYQTGKPRKAFHYPDLDITKYINWEGVGDITGESAKVEFKCLDPLYLARIASRDDSSLVLLPWRVANAWYLGWECSR